MSVSTCNQFEMPYYSRQERIQGLVFKTKEKIHDTSNVAYPEGARELLESIEGRLEEFSNQVHGEQRRSIDFHCHKLNAILDCEVIPHLLLGDCDIDVFEQDIIREFRQICEIR